MSVVNCRTRGVGEAQRCTYYMNALYWTRSPARLTKSRRGRSNAARSRVSTLCAVAVPGQSPCSRRRPGARGGLPVATGCQGVDLGRKEAAGVRCAKIRSAGCPGGTSQSLLAHSDISIWAPRESPSNSGRQGVCACVRAGREEGSKDRIGSGGVWPGTRGRGRAGPFKGCGP